jgi:signal transduction histidine kinase
MDLITKERDRLLQRTARIYGLSFTVISVLCLLLPGAVGSSSLLLAIAPYLLLALAQWLIGAGRAPLWAVVQVVSAVAVVVIVTTSSPDAAGGGEGLAAALMTLSSASVASIALVLTSSAARVALLITSFIVVSSVTLLLTSAGAVEQPIRLLGPLVLGWGLPAFIAVWISAGVPQAAKRIASIGRAHRAERQASELEAQRRQSARLLHDTVLATLTLLAHSGVGVSEEALREQAGGDAKLLRQLRLGGTPTPTASGEYNLAPVQETELGTTLESVKSRFGRMGLEVSWHGTGQVLLPSHILDAFLLALAECLENVRRHSGVTQAHVTITEDETTLRAMVTDSGVGFDIAGVGEAKLGFAESVVARLRDVGGNARLFSAPGAGTTVVLEVPR